METKMGLLDELQNNRRIRLEAIETNHDVITQARKRLEILNADIADLDRAIAALTPAPAAVGEVDFADGEFTFKAAQAVEAEPAIPDALAEFMKREGAKLYPADLYELPEDTVATDRVSCLLSSDFCIGPCEADGVEWEDRNPPHIKAYINHTRLALEKLDKTTPRDEAEPPPICSEGVGLDAFSEPETRAGFVDAEPAPVLRADVPLDAETFAAPSGELFATVNGETRLVISEPLLTDEVLEAITELAEAKLAEQEAELAPLLPPEPPKPATPEEMMACGYVNDEASWWSRKMAKEKA